MPYFLDTDNSNDESINIESSWKKYKSDNSDETYDQNCDHKLKFDSKEMKELFSSPHVPETLNVNEESNMHENHGYSFESPDFERFKQDFEYTDDESIRNQTYEQGMKKNYTDCNPIFINKLIFNVQL